MNETLFTNRRTNRAANLATVGFAGLAVFQAVLAAGAPLGAAAWGGSDAHLSSGRRAASAITIVFYLAAIVVVRRAAAGLTDRRYRAGSWAFGVTLAASGLLNLASASPWERYLLAPLALILAALTVVVARAPSGEGRLATPPC